MKSITTATENETTVINTVLGQVTVDEIFDHVSKNGDSWVRKSVIWDVSGADISEITSEEWSRLIQMAKPLSEKRAGEKTAIVSSKDLNFGMLRMLEIVAKALEFKIELRTFRTVEKAREWLLRE